VRLSTLRQLSRKQWLFVAAGAVVLVLGTMTAVWTVRHAWAIYRLNRGVGDTVFLDATGRPWFRLDEQRRDVPFDQISTYFKDAVIAVEDHRYYSHPGIDPIGFSRAFFHNLSSDSGRQGGSTVTQQLARTLYLSNSGGYTRKAQEGALAVMLEVFLSKKEILLLYMNRVYLSGGVYGVETMSRKMFDKPAARLTLGEAALIAGIIRGPAPYSPWNHPEAARQRSYVVLQRMREEGKITAAQEQAARAERITVRRQTSVSSARYGYAKEYLRQQFRNVYGGDNPPDWKVQTTFVPAIQDAAETAVRDGLRRLGIRGLQAALVALDPETGNILAMVGGADFAATPFNRAVRSHRQPGSAFKPFVYAAALERGKSPVSTVSGLRQVAVQAPEGVWIPRDERAGTEDVMTLREALTESNNAAAVLLQQQVGTRPVIRLATDLGVTNQPDVPSLALGSGLVTPMDLTTAYAVFPNGGYRVRPRGIVSVMDASGDRVLQIHSQREQILSPEVAFQMVTMLRDVVDQGTGSRVRSLGVRGAIAGKTGTTSEYRDGWFVGFSRSAVVGVWVGFDQPQTIAEGASGSRVAIPIWSEFMRRTAGQLPAGAFVAPRTLREEELCRMSHARPLDGCTTYVEYFKDGDEVPSQLCTLHGGSLKQRAHRAVQGLLGALGRSVRGIFQ
jgi:penicillin-binding protein 1A